LLGGSHSSGAFDQPLWVLSIASGQARRLGNLIGHDAAWSPDGQRIAYAGGTDPSGPSDAYIARKDGSEARKLLTMQKGRIIGIRWSPDGKVLRLSLVQSDSCSLWDVSVDGSNLHRVKFFSEGDRDVCDFLWTPDGRYSLFSWYDPASSAWNLWALRESKPSFFSAAPKPLQLTTGVLGFSDLAPSPDGKQIFAIGGQTRGELVAYDFKSGRPEPYLSGISADHLDFSRDGKWVTYVTYPEGVLWRSSLDGKDRMQLTVPPLYVVLPQWSPDGTRITFTGQMPGEHYKIYVISSEGGKPEAVSEGQKDELDSTWAPDGNSLVFGESQWAADAKISSVDLRTGRVSVIPGSQGLYSPRVSPDGRFILAQDTAGSRKLLLFDQQTQKWTLLLDGKTFGFGWPQWSGDGEYVYAQVKMREEAASSIYVLGRVGVANHKLERVAAVKIPKGTTGWGHWMGVTPNGSPLLLRDLSIQEVYALDVELP